MGLSLVGLDGDPFVHFGGSLRGRGGLSDDIVEDGLVCKVLFVVIFVEESRIEGVFCEHDAIVDDFDVGLRDGEPKSISKRSNQAAVHVSPNNKCHYDVAPSVRMYIMMLRLVELAGAYILYLQSQLQEPR